MAWRLPTYITEKQTHFFQATVLEFATSVLPFNPIPSLKLECKVNMGKLLSYSFTNASLASRKQYTAFGRKLHKHVN